jgi:hypothetical protein
LIEENRRLAKAKLEARRQSSDARMLPPIDTAPSIARPAVESSLYCPIPNVRPVAVPTAEPPVECGTQSGDSFVYIESQTASSLEHSHDGKGRADKQPDALPPRTTDVVNNARSSNNSNSSSSSSKSSGDSKYIHFQTFPEPLKSLCTIYRWASSSSAVPLSANDLAQCRPPADGVMRRPSSGLDDCKRPCVLYWPVGVFRRSGNRAMELVQYLSSSLDAPIVVMVNLTLYLICHL